MNTYSNEKNRESNDRALSRVLVTTDERALKKDIANNILRILSIEPSAETAFYKLTVKNLKK